MNKGKDNPPRGENGGTRMRVDDNVRAVSGCGDGGRRTLVDGCRLDLKRGGIIEYSLGEGRKKLVGEWAKERRLVSQPQY